MVVVVVLFLTVFLAIMVSVGLAMSYFRSKQKQQIRSMLQKAEATPAEQRSELLRPAAVEDKLSKLLSRFHLIDDLNLMLQQAGNNGGASRLLTLSAALFVGGCLAGYKVALLAPLFSALLFGVAAGALPFVMMRWKRKRTFKAFEDQLPEALDFLSRSLRAGHGFTVALEILSTDSPDPLGSAFRKVSNDLQLGSSLDVALKKMGTMLPLLDVRFFISAVLLQQETGGNLGEILTKLAHIIRERFRLRGQVKAASAHGRITALVLTLMPLGVTGFMLVINKGYLDSMLAVDIGRYMVYGAAVGQVIGWLVIQKIVNFKV
ncbi:MAG TPA: type II secretion system F family protein [Bryobacteraceae bacterium]|jgi:tight adherence protein B|nr:type II secretion system F family protein [Bryobacteraceae bacterium]